uniref:Uncharacterized protein n=1 Tax=Steinernema glaseri TaxID=37863 RepID=A0A1I7XZN1_9BILA
MPRVYRRDGGVFFGLEAIFFDSSSDHITTNHGSQPYISNSTSAFLPNARTGSNRASHADLHINRTVNTCNLCLPKQ